MKIGFQDRIIDVSILRLQISACLQVAARDCGEKERWRDEHTQIWERIKRNEDLSLRAPLHLLLLPQVRTTLLPQIPTLQKSFAQLLRKRLAATSSRADISSLYLFPATLISDTWRSKPYHFAISYD
jgi:hypothetical protein